MVEQHQAPRHGRVLWGVRPTGEDHRATTFELFFDLVYVFAATQVTSYMAHEHSGHGVLQGLLLALLWWTWSGHGNWRLHSAGHWTERHGEFIILALGESVVAIGVGAATQPISTPLLLAAILGVAAVGLWWLYFDPDRRRDHPACADPTQPPRRIVPGQSTRLSACALRLASTK
jgi:low temperature requirement protein LtrA